MSVVCLWHVVVDHNVDPLDVDAATDKIRGDQNTFLPLLELLVNRESAQSKSKFWYMDARNCLRSTVGIV